MFCFVFSSLSFFIFTLFSISEGNIVPPQYSIYVTVKILQTKHVIIESNYTNNMHKVFKITFTVS